MGGEEFKWRTISYRASKDPILVHTVQLKSIPQEKMVSSGVLDVVIVSVHSEKIHLKKLMMMMKMMMIIVIMNKSQETAVFSSRQKLLPP